MTVAASISWTTAGTILRVPADPTVDPYDDQPAAEPAATGIPSHLELQSGDERVAGGEATTTRYRLACPAGTDLRRTDQWRDEATGVVYDVEWTFAAPHPRLGMVTAGLVLHEGAP